MDQSPKPALVFNAKDYGAIGNNNANDTVAIQATITAASGTGGIVFLPPGTYLTDSLNITSLTNIVLRGAGDASILKLNSNPTQNIQGLTTWLLIDSCAGCAVEEMQFNLNNREHCAIGAINCTDIYIQSNYIHNSPGTIGDGRPAILAHSSVSVRILNNYINDVSAWVCFGLSTTLGQITDSICSGNIFRNGKSTSAANCTRSVITSNVFDTCLYAGLELGGVGTAMTDWLVNDNVFKSCTAPALQVSALTSGFLTRDGIISNNTFADNLDAAIYCFGNAVNVNITDNNIRDSVNGVVLSLGAGGGCQRFTVKNNQIYDTRASGSRTMAYGITLALSTSGSGTISGEALADIDICDNRIRNTTDTGILLSWSSGTASFARCRIFDNTITSCTNFGISIGVGNPIGLYSSMSCERNQCVSNGSQIRLSIDSGDINTWIFRGNAQINALGSPYLVGGLGGVPAYYDMRGTGTPEAAIIAGIGSTYIDVAGGVGTTFYVKQTGTGNTGWSPSLGGATSSTDNAIARFDGTIGKIQNSSVIIDDSNNVTGVASLTAGTSSLTGTTEASAIGTANFVNPGGQSVAKRSFLGTIGATFKGNVNAGVQDATAAIVGQVGQRISSTVATSLAGTGTVGDITFLSLTPGDWDISAFCVFSSGATGFTSGSTLKISIVTTTATNGTSGTNMVQQSVLALLANGLFTLTIPKISVNISSTTIYYLTEEATFAGGSPVANATIIATRAR